MANSNLLKEAIADAKAVRETAIANAKIALEEAFTPRLQSILSQKLQQEMEEGEDKEEDVNEEYGAEDTSDADSSGIDGDNKQPADDANSSSDIAQGNPDTEAETSEVGSEDDNTEKAAVSESEKEVTEGEEITEEEEVEESTEVSEGDEVTEGEEEGEEVEETYHEEEESDDDELDLESIIRELEEELSEEEEADHQEELDAEEKEEVEDIADDAVDSHEEEKHDGEEEVSEDSHEGEEEDLDEEIDLNEILKEMGYGEDEDESEEEVSEEVVEETNELEETKAELEEAMSTIKELKSTINEVNLLNAKLLYTNKLFRSYDLTNDQKMKVVETLDRTGNVREVKLVFSTLAESFKFNGTARKQKQSAKINESFASKPVASTAPTKEVIAESTNAIAERFKKLANIK